MPGSKGQRRHSPPRAALMCLAKRDESGCDRLVCMGTPTPIGYRHTCHKHDPSKALEDDE